MRVTATTITDEQIRQLHAGAVADGDNYLCDVCCAALRPAGKRGSDARPKAAAAWNSRCAT